MTRKIFHSILLASIGVFLASLMRIVGVLYRYFTQLQMEQLQTQTALAAQGISYKGIEYFENLNLNKVRITWVDSQGQVRYDSQSDSEEMENHLSREEIREALDSGSGESVRYSSTLAQSSLYVAKRLDDETVVRLSVSQNSNLLLLLRILPATALIFVLAFLLSLMVAKYTSKRIIAPLNRLNLDSPLDNQAYEELSPLLRRIDQHQQELSQKENLLARKQKEFETIISKIKEGMLLLDDRRRIVSINAAAKSLFGVDEDCLGKSILEINRSPYLNQLLDEGLAGKKGEGLLVLGEIKYKTLIRPIFSERTVTGLAILTFDATEQLQMEQLRREFTANVSHELKTPLHLISGYSEIIKSQLVSAEDVQKFSEKIYEESQRMVQLVDDIIKLSHLDEASQVSMERVDLYAIANNVLDSLSRKASQKHVALRLAGQPTLLEGNPSLLHSIIYNLCDNAIKYNKENGQVHVAIVEDDQAIILEVTDTGIGISAEDKERIFERFYRVDKSRSKKVGGTGLGMSIVKHAVHIHQASISISSEMNKGTKITVWFPKH